MQDSHAVSCHRRPAGSEQHKQYGVTKFMHGRVSDVAAGVLYVAHATEM
jgi:hypothetical protein